MASQTQISQDEADWGRQNTFGVAIASALEVAKIGARFDTKQILSDISFSAKPGEVISLLGPSGSGKTTLLRIMAGLEMPSEGSVHIDGKVMVDADTFVEPEKRGVGMVFQDYALFPHLSILQNVSFGLTRMSASERKAQAMKMLERVGMEQLANAYPHTLSGGEQQRVALARALVPRPGILLMDEPFSGLDSRLRDSVRAKTIELLRDTKATVILVTHDPEEALRVSDRIILMQKGQVVQQGTCDELYYGPNSLFAAGFFSELNHFVGSCENGKVVTPLGAFPASGVEENQQADVCLRFADLVVGTGPIAPDKQAEMVSILGKVTKRQFMGIVEQVDIFVPGHDVTLIARMKSGQLDPQASTVNVSARIKDVMVFPK